MAPTLTSTRETTAITITRTGEPDIGGTNAGHSQPVAGTCPGEPAETGAGDTGAGAGPGWLALSAALSDETPIIAEREDLVVTIAPGLGRGSPACFDPTSATIEVDGTHLGDVDPDSVRPSEAADRDRYPIMWGLLTHECAHAHHTRWNDTLAAATPPGALAAATLLEESRIEAAHIRRRPDDRHWLRASATALILATAPLVPASTVTNPSTGTNKDGADPTGSTMSRWDAARAAALLLARVDATVLAATETASVAREAEAVLGEDTLAQLRALWQSAHTLTDDDTDGMLALGARWCTALGADPDTVPTVAVCTSAAPHETPRPGPVPVAGAAGAVGTPTAVLSPLGQAIAEDLAGLAATVAAETSPASEPGTVVNGAVSAPREKHTTAVGSAAHTVFTRGGSRGLGGKYGRTAIRGTRAPSTPERLAARQLGRALSSAGIRDRARTVTSSRMPPGRLRMRGVLAGHAQRAAGAIPTAEPFTRVTRTVVPTPPLRLGVACDVSGSMGQFTSPVASTAWILAHAAHHAHIPASSTATVIFGNRVRPITHPATAPRHVTEFVAEDSRHDIPTAIAALDQALGLSLPGAARLLVIVSDGLYHGEVRDKGQAQVTALRAAGCGVLWLAPADEGAVVEPFDHVTVCPLTDPAATAHSIAGAAATALRTAH